jgi:flagellar biosynthetic protein FliP
MLAAMFLGMFVLGAPLVALLGVAGISMTEVHDKAPAGALLGMAVTMTVPMIGWMIHRGHTWRPNAEMAAAMFLPTFGVIGLLWSGAVVDFGALMMLEHVVMLPAMLVAMLLRRDEYSGHHHHHAALAG